MMFPRGAIAPIPTPVTAELDFDPKAQRAHLEWLAGEGLDGALVLGSNGEFPSFSLEERRAVAEAAASVESGLDLLLGVGSCAIPEVLEMSRVAFENGYKAVLCPPPFYFRAAPINGIADFFFEVLDQSRVPVLLYHIPQVTGIGFADDLLDLIGEHDNLAGIKDSSGDLTELRRLTGRFQSRSYLVGTDLLATACLAAGGKGSISAGASVAPRLVSKVHCGKEDQEILNKVRKLLEEYGLGSSVKMILRRYGFGRYATRPPMRNLEKAREEGLWAEFIRHVPETDRPKLR